MLSNNNFVIYPKSSEEKILPDFSLKELRCSCIYIHCKATILYKPLLDLLQKVRDEIASPLIATSCFRCSEKNKDERGAALSGHLLGAAADIQTALPIDPIILASICQKHGALGIGTYKKHLHIDLLYGLEGKERRWESSRD